MGNFENDLRDMFDGVEFKPSDKVWAGVEKELKQKKKKGIFFMWQTYGVAAALAFLLTVGGLYTNGFFSNTQDPSQKNQLLTEGDQNANTADSLNKSNQNQSLLAEDQNANDESDDDSSIVVPPKNSKENTFLAENQAKKNSNLIEYTEDNSTEFKDPKSSTEDLIVKNNEGSVNQQVVLKLAESKPYRESLAATQVLWLKGLGVDESELSAIVNVAEVESETFQRERIINGRLGNNNFNISETNNGSVLNAFDVESANLAARATISNEEEKALGAISIGLGFSFELNKRFQLNTSLRYSEFRISSTSNAYSVENGESLPIYLPLGYDPNNVNFIGNYNITNTQQGLSIQPTVSYKLAQFGKFDVSVAAGAGFDYFFSYRIKGDLNFLSVRKANLNDSGFIQKFNISSVTGLGLNYRINDQFGLGADISYRYFIPTKTSENRRQSSVLGFGLGLNYYLNRREE